MKKFALVLKTPYNSFIFNTTKTTISEALKEFEEQNNQVDSLKISKNFHEWKILNLAQVSTIELAQVL